MRLFLILGGIGAVVALALASAAVWFYKSSLELRTVGDSATFEESAECLYLYANPFTDRTYSLKLDRGRVEACFPPQTAAKTLVLIACFNTYERTHRGHFDWPGANLRACTWDGVTPSRSIATVRLGNVVAVPAVPRAGRHVVLEIGTGGADAEIVDEAVESETLEVEVLIQGDEAADVTFLDLEYGLEADGKLHVTSVVPATAAGKRLTLSVTTAPDTPSEVATVASFTVAP